MTENVKYWRMTLLMLPLFIAILRFAMGYDGVRFFVWDDFIAIEGAIRAAKGQIPHTDFSTQLFQLFLLYASRLLHRLTSSRGLEWLYLIQINNYLTNNE